MPAAAVILALVTLQRGGELWLSARNTRRLLAGGAIEHGAGHYPLMVALHATWLGALWVTSWDRPVAIGWLALFILLQAGRVWVIASLGPRWTTRIIVVPGAALVASGPYRIVAHPNYVIVAAEIVVLPLVFGQPLIAVAFSVLNAALMVVRIRAETQALDAAAGLRPGAASRAD